MSGPIPGSEILAYIHPFVLGWIDAYQIQQAVLGGGTAFAPTPHALNGVHHSGTLDDIQAPQFLKTDGSRALTGNLAVSPSVTIDGVDISVLAATVGGIVGANPTASVGLTAVNGSATTFMRSDAAPPLSLGIVPTWTGKHIFPAGANGAQLGDFTNSNHTHLSAAQGGTLGAGAIASGLLALARGGTNADLSATGAASSYLKQSSAGAAITVGTIPAADIPSLPASIITSGLLALARGGTNADLSATGGAGQYVKQSGAGAALSVGTIPAADLPGSFSGFANPTASIGLTAINGAATSAMRSDAAPALSVSITPTWSATHTFTLAPVFSAITAGSVLFASTAGLLSQDNANLFWDNTNKRLGVNAASSPQAMLDVGGGANTTIDTVVKTSVNFTGITGATGKRGYQQAITFVGNTGSGAGPFYGMDFQITSNITTTTNQPNLAAINASLTNPSGYPTGNLVGLSFAVSNADGSNNGTMYGVRSYATDTHATGSRSSIFGILGEALPGGAGTYADVNGVTGAVDLSGVTTFPTAAAVSAFSLVRANVTVTDLVMYDMQFANQFGGGQVVTNFYGLRILNPGVFSGSIGTAYGVKIADLTGAGTNWSIYTGSAASYFGGLVGVTTLTPRRKLDVLDTANPQLRLTYTDNTVYTDFLTDSAGNLSVTPTGPLMKLINTTRLQSSNYASQTTGWGISGGGAADFRYVYADELHAKAFISDIEQALAGGQLITKSVAKVAATFTLPAAAASGTLVVEELAGFTGQVFVNGDLVRLKQTTRAADTSLTIADGWGTVTYLSRDGTVTPPTQSYTWLRSANPNAGGASGTILLGTLALDYGTVAASYGYHEVSAVDGAYGVNAPYSQVVTWATHPAVQANRTVRTRLGNLKGITGALEYGLYAGNVVDGGSLASTNRYLRISDTTFQLNNLDLSVYNGGVKVIALDYATPYLSLGAAAPTGWLQASGFWVGNVGGTYKAHLGSVSGGLLNKGLAWDGAGLTIVGNVSIGGNISYGVNVGEALMLTHYDGPRPYEIDYTGTLTGHRGQVGTITGGGIFRPGKFGKALQMAEGTTNLIRNPSGELNATDWVSSYTVTTTQSSTYALYGTYSLKSHWTSGAGFDVYSNVAGTLANSTQYTVSVYARRSDGAAVTGVSLYCDTSGALITPTIVSVGNGWYYLYGTKTTGAAANQVVGIIGLATSVDWYFDGWQCEAKAYPTPYADGSLGQGHTWQGTAHASKSDRVAATLSYPTASCITAVAGTVSAWVYINAYNPNVCILWQAGSLNAYLDCYISQTGSVFFRVNSVNIIHGTTLTKSAWHHIVCVWDTIANTANVYLDGVAGPGGVPTTTLPPLNAAMGVGYSVPLASTIYEVNGLIDDFCTLPLALTASDIKAIYDSNQAVTATTGVGELRLMGGSTSTINAGYVLGNNNGLFGIDSLGHAAFGLTTAALNANLWGANQSEALASGAVMLGSNEVGYANMLWDPTAKQFKFRGGTTVQGYIDTNGAATFGVGKVVLDVNGITITGITKNILFNTASSSVSGYLTQIVATSSPVLELGNVTTDVTAKATVSISAGGVGKSSTLFLITDNATGGNYADFSGSPSVFLGLVVGGTGVPNAMLDVRGAITATSYLELAEIAAPANPASGKGRFYFDSTQSWPYFITDAPKTIPMGIARLSFSWLWWAGLDAGVNYVRVNTVECFEYTEPGTQQSSNNTFLLPQGWAGRTLTISVYWSPSTTNTGNMQFNYEFRRLIHGSLVPAAATTSVVITTAGPGTINQVVKATTTVSLSGFSENDIMDIKMYRLDTNAGDTFTGSARLYSVELSVVG